MKSPNSCSQPEMTYHEDDDSNVHVICTNKLCYIPRHVVLISQGTSLEKEKDENQAKVDALKREMLS